MLSGMRNRLFSTAGFSIKELIMTLVVIGILGVIAIPPYFSLQETRRVTRMQRLVKQLNVSVNVIKNSDGAYPKTLDNASNGEFCKACFVNLVPRLKVDQSEWYKVSDTEYLFFLDGFDAKKANFELKGDYRITYDPNAGTFDIRQNPY